MSLIPTSDLKTFVATAVRSLTEPSMQEVANKGTVRLCRGRDILKFDKNSADL